jgi:hypothetical protein
MYFVISVVGMIKIITSVLNLATYCGGGTSEAAGLPTLAKFEQAPNLSTIFEFAKWVLILSTSTRVEASRAVQGCQRTSS